MYRYPGERPKLSAAEINRQNEAVDRLAFGRRGLAEQSLDDDAQSHWVWIRNDSGADRSRFDCMSLGEPLYEMLEDGTVDLLFGADTADPAGTPVILLEPIADGAYGRGVIHGLALAKVGGGTGVLASPDATNHRLSPGSGSIKLLSAPHATDPKLRPVLLGSGGDNCILVKTPGGGIPACTGSGPYTFGSASCTVVDDAGVVGSSSVTVKNIVGQAIAANVIGKAERYGSIWVIDVASCG